MTATAAAPAPKKERELANKNNEMIRTLQSIIPGMQVRTGTLDELWVNKANNIRGLQAVAYSEDQIQDMMASIEAVGGIMQSVLCIPLVPKPETDNKPLALGAGFRRIIAAKRLAEQDPKYGKNIPMIIVPEVRSKIAMKILQLMENVTRVDLTPIEKATTIEDIVSDTTANLKYKDVAAIMGMSAEDVSNHVRLLKLPKEIQDMVTEGKLSFGATKLLLADRVPPADWVDLAKTAQTMTYGAFLKMLDTEYGTKEDGATTTATGMAADGSQQKVAKMAKSSDINNSYIPWLKKRLEIADKTKKDFTAADLDQARLDAFRTVMLEETSISKEIQPFLAEQKAAEEKAEQEKAANEKLDEFLAKAVASVEEIANAKPDPAKPDAPRPTLAGAYASVTQRVYTMKDEEKKALGFTLPEKATDFQTKLAAAYQATETKRAEDRKQRAEKKAKKEADEAAKKAAAASIPGSDGAPNGTAPAGAGAGAGGSGTAAPGPSVAAASAG